MCFKQFDTQEILGKCEKSQHALRAHYYLGLFSIKHIPGV